VRNFKKQRKETPMLTQEEAKEFMRRYKEVVLETPYGA